MKKNDKLGEVVREVEVPDYIFDMPWGGYEDPWPRLPWD